MPRPFHFRVIALVVALLGSLAAPASAVTHGWLHEHAAHERADDHGHVADTKRDAVHAEPAHDAGFEQADDHHRHGHDAVDVGPTARDALRLTAVAGAAAIVARVQLPMTNLVELPSAAFLNRALLARPDPGGTSPPSLRAPPVS